MGSERGFTLIEIMIVVVIIGLLASIAIPALNLHLIRSYNAAAVSDTKNLEIFQQSFYTEYFEYAPLVPADKNASGLVSKNVNLVNGGTAQLTITVLTPEIEIAAKITADAQHAIFAAHHPSGDKIIAMDTTEGALLRELDFRGNMTVGDIPDSTNGYDLSSWNTWNN